LAQMSVEIEPAANRRDAAALVAQIEKAFETTLSLRVPVRVVASGTLPRFEMKAKRWIRT